MSPVVAFLRLSLLFLNVYETFKTLKSPPNSSRTGEPTVRALSQRKRDMKGCMTIWLVWCSCTLLERIFDTILGIFMPFYSEFKATIYLFQILTRARGTEPIYLHVLRPLIKPYVATLDWTLELVNILGDFLLLIITLPYHLSLEWWRPSVIQPLELDRNDNLEESAKESQKNGPETKNIGDGVDVVGTRRAKQLVDKQTGEVRNVNNVVVSRSIRSSSRVFPESRSDKAVSKQKYEIWHPPTSAFGPDERPAVRQSRRIVSDSAVATKALVADVRPMPPIESAASYSASSASERFDIDELRAYPPFPSAYPPTPRISSSSDELYVPASDVQLVTLDVEEWRQYPPFPSAYPPTPQVVARKLHSASSQTRQSMLEPVEEQEHLPPDIPPDTGGKQSNDLPLPSPWEASHKRASIQSLPSRKRNRPRIDAEFVSDQGVALDATSKQDFGLSLGRLRESTEDSSSHSGPSDKGKIGEAAWSLDGNLNGKIRNEAHLMASQDGSSEEMKIEVDTYDSDDDSFNVTLRTPARITLESKCPQKRSRSWSNSSKHHEARDLALQNVKCEKTNAESLTVPSSTRTNSVNTLSSLPSRSSSGTSFTTDSRVPSLRTMSRQSSTKNDNRGEVSKTFDTNSIIGIKRTRLPTTKVNARDAKATSSACVVSRHISRNVSSGSEASRKSARVAMKPTNVPRTSRTNGKQSLKAVKENKANDSDTMESSGEPASTVSQQPVKRRRKVEGGAVPALTPAATDTRNGARARVTRSQSRSTS